MKSAHIHRTPHIHPKIRLLILLLALQKRIIVALHLHSQSHRLRQNLPQLVLPACKLHSALLLEHAPLLAHQRRHPLGNVVPRHLLPVSKLRPTATIIAIPPRLVVRRLHNVHVLSLHPFLLLAEHRQVVQLAKEILVLQLREYSPLHHLRRILLVPLRKNLQPRLSPSRLLRLPGLIRGKHLQSSTENILNAPVNVRRLQPLETILHARKVHSRQVITLPSANRAIRHKLNVKPMLYPAKVAQAKLAEPHVRLLLPAPLRVPHKQNEKGALKVLRLLHYPVNSHTIILLVFVNRLHRQVQRNSLVFARSLRHSHSLLRSNIQRLKAIKRNSDLVLLILIQLRHHRAQL